MTPCQGIPVTRVQEPGITKMDTFKKHGVYKKSPIVERLEKAGKPVGVKCVYTNKRDKDKPEHRCMLVATEVKAGTGDDLLTAIRPLEAHDALSL
jgi:hypothetical protein